MLINSLEFWGFLAAFIVPYYAVAGLGGRWQNAWLLCASVLFYGCASWQLLSLLGAVTLLFYWAAQYAGQHQRHGRPVTIAAVTVAVGLLFIFKYLNFAIDSVASMLQMVGLKADAPTVNLLVPLGISYYTFKLISYIVDVHKQKLQAETSLVRFAAYVMFFPTIMSGPIDRYVDFGPQLKAARRLDGDNLAEGARRVLWGMLLKMCVADRIAPYTDAVFNNVANHSGITIIAASMLYLIQMYSDFAGYSSMAIGVGRMMGLTVMENFERPLLSLDAGIFWRRWHMSLSYWLRDYVYIPLGGSRCPKWRSYANVMITFVLCGAWHGANWTFILFGAHHGLLVIFSRLTKQWWQRVEGMMSGCQSLYLLLRRLWLFVLCSIGAMYFRSNSLAEVGTALRQVGSGLGSLYTEGTTAMLSVGMMAVAIMLWKEYNDESGSGRHYLHNDRQWIRVVSFAALTVFVLLTGQLTGGSFIYVQF